VEVHAGNRFMVVDIEVKNHELSSDELKDLERGSEAMAMAQARELFFKRFNLSLDLYSRTLKGVQDFSESVLSIEQDIDALVEQDENGVHAQRIADLRDRAVETDKFLDASHERLAALAVRIDAYIAVMQDIEGSSSDALLSLDRARATAVAVREDQELRRARYLQRLSREIDPMQKELQEDLRVIEVAFEDIVTYDDEVSEDDFAEMDGYNPADGLDTCESFLADRLDVLNPRLDEASEAVELLETRDLDLAEAGELRALMDEVMRKDVYAVDDVPREFSVRMSFPDIVEDRRLQRAKAGSVGAGRAFRQEKKRKPRFYESKEKKAAWKKRVDAAYNFFREQRTYQLLAAVEQDFVKRIVKKTEGVRAELRVCVESTELALNKVRRLQDRAYVLKEKLVEFGEIEDIATDHDDYVGDTMEAITRLHVDVDSDLLERFLEHVKQEKKDVRSP